MEGLTAEQKAFRVRKLKTRFNALDINGDGFVSAEDYEELAKKFIEYGRLSGEQVTRLQKGVQDIKHNLGLKPGVKINLEQYLQSIFTAPAKERDSLSTAGREGLKISFDMIDTDADGIISVKEFEVYFMVIGVGKEHAKASFDAIDTDRDGSISRDEFVSAAVQFYNNTDPAHPSTLFFGPLVD